MPAAVQGCEAAVARPSPPISAPPPAIKWPSAPERMPERGGEAPPEGAGCGRQVLPLAAAQSLGAAAAGGAGRAAVLAAHPAGPAGVCPCSALPLRRSPGEVCFPGGKSEENDKDEIDTALREAKEEVGLPPEKVEVICRLVPGIDKMNYLVTPVVGFIEDTFQATPNPDEVSDVFVMPLEYFIKPLNYMTLPYKTSSGYLTWMHCFTYYDHERNKSFKIWGLTAHFAVFLALLVFRTKPTFEVDYDLDNLIASAESKFMNLYASLNEKKRSNL
ncbi:peroxisomal coenzyme A diphosphatase NUDT7 isoform X2 [Cygnus olor]|uniref:peroxisomal coenzyme A diphosphatase NUDT7 isoform X2 n=2 Tax=Cygnus olor TaxID=8869 RepID=UPI001ADE8AA2|nr:peroxisomal coenzyme A diphosphatase NUDT7 isoform X2 [Cygnus olor]